MKIRGRDKSATKREKEQEIQTEKFRELIKEMYKGFPNIRTSENLVKQVIVTEKDRDALVQRGYLIKEDHVANGKTSSYYGLGPNSLSLISAWKSEELNERIMKMNVAVVLLASLTVFVSIVTALQTITDPFLKAFVVFGEGVLIAIMAYVFLLFKPKKH